MNNDKFPSVQDLQNEWNWGWFTDASQLKFYVQYNWITQQDYKNITGQDYSA